MAGFGGARGGRRDGSSISAGHTSRTAYRQIRVGPQSAAAGQARSGDRLAAQQGGRHRRRGRHHRLWRGGPAGVGLSAACAAADHPGRVGCRARGRHRARRVRRAVGESVGDQIRHRSGNQGTWHHHRARHAPVSAEQIAATAAILLAAYFIRGITGFGSGLISVPLLALFLPLKFVVPLILLLDFTASVVLGGLHFQRVKWGEIGVLIPLGLVGVVLGTRLLPLAGLVSAFAARSVFNTRGDKPISRGWAVPAALTSGTMGALVGTGG